MMEQANDLLTSLGYFSLQELISLDKIDVSAVQRKRLIEPQTIKANLLQLQAKTLTNKIQPLSQFKPALKDGFRLNKFFASASSLMFWPQRIQMQQMYEVTGKTNTGKTFLCYCLLQQALSNDKEVILLDTSDNFCPQKLAEWFGVDFITKYKSSIKWIKVNNIKQFGESMYFLRQLLVKFDIPTVVIVDNLSLLIEDIPFSENGATFTALRRLLHNLIDTTMTCLLFTTLSNSSLFHTQFHKDQEHRFKNMHAAMWDSLSNNTVLLDSVLQVNEETGEVLRRTKVCLTKAVKQNRFATFQTLQC